MIKAWTLYWITFVIVFCVNPQPGEACSTFCLDHDDGPIFGRNYDWHLEDALVVVNKRNIAKTALVQDNPVRWVSIYASVTFNQYGIDLPMGGMNEAGLVVEQMGLHATEYPVPDARPSLFNLQWTQYQLDTSGTIEDVIASEAHIRIAPTYGKKIHYLVCDQTGRCLSVESIDGKMVYYTGEEMPVKVLTNSTYAKSVKALRRYKGVTRLFLKFAEEKGSDSLARFIRAANMVTAYASNGSLSPVGYAFEILDKVAGSATKWQIVYDSAKQHVYFRTLTHPNIRSVDLSAFDFSCERPVKILDMSTDFSGDVSDKFVEYTRQRHQDLVEQTFKKTSFLADIPAEVIEQVVLSPECAVCQSKRHVQSP